MNLCFVSAVHRIRMLVYGSILTIIEVDFRKSSQLIFKIIKRDKIPTVIIKLGKKLLLSNMFSNQRNVLGKAK